MNAIEKLMKFDARSIKIPTKVVKMKLGKLNGEEFEFNIKGLTPRFIAEIQESMLKLIGSGNKKDKKMEAKIKSFDGNIRMIVEGCPEVFKNQGLIDNFGVQTPSELVEKLLLQGEIEFLAGEIENLSGYEEISEDEIKN